MDKTMVELLQKFCELNQFEYQSADDVLAKGDLSENQEDFLKAYIVMWNIVVETT